MNPATPSAPISNDEMMARVLRFKEMTQHGIPLMFIDSILPGHRRMNYSVIGDTASENPDFKPLIPGTHNFQIGMLNCPPNSGPAYHTHDYIELFLPLSGRWRFYWGNDGDADPEGETVLDPWDIISLPPRLYRGFENVSSEHAWCFAVLESHGVFEGKDPYWSPRVIRQAEAFGFQANDKGKMIKPDNYDALKAEIEAELRKGMGI